MALTGVFLAAVIMLGSACGRTPEPPGSTVVEAISRSHPGLATPFEQARVRPVRSVGPDYRIGPATGVPRGLPPEAAARLALRRRAQHPDVTAELPGTADGTVRLSVARGEFAVGVRHPGAAASKATLDHGALVYRDAVPGVDILWFAHGDSVEELWRVRTRRAVPGYHLDLPPGATLHSVSRGLIELRDAHGTAWMRLTARRAWDAGGRKLRPELVVAGNSVQVRIAPDATLPVVIDPEWESSTALSSIREHGTATVLPSGRVLLAGGTAAAAGYLEFAELYDPKTGTFTTTGHIIEQRIYHTATLLRSGKVLIVGGAGPVGGFHATAELYDEQTGLFTQTGSMSTVRADQTATMLASGKVLVAGGKDQLSKSVSSAELYDPTSGTFAAAASLAVARYGHTATRLRSGKVLIAGGYHTNSSASVVPNATAEIFDPSAGATGSFSLTGSMSAARARQIATLLPSGKVLVTAGTGTSGSLASAELFDPASGSFSPTGSLTTARTWPSAVLLPSGDVLVTGGETGGVGLFSSELYNPQSGSFGAAPSMTVQRVHHNSVMLPNGKVLVAGGPYSTVADLFDPVAAPGTATATGSMNDARRYATATLLPSGKVLVAGGQTSAGPLATAELYDPVTRTFTATASMPTPRSKHTATLLASGKVLVAGGESTGGDQTAEAELYDPAAGTFTPTGAMTVSRDAHTATLLSTGEVLIVGGVTSGNAILSSAELYDPSSGTFKTTGNMTAQRFGHTATLLPSGKVLVAAGITGNLTAELYDRSANGGAGAFSPVGNLTRARFQHTATLLSSGKVLLAGGTDGSTPLATAELYDPATGGFTQTASMFNARSGHSATMLPSGDVLFAGGQASTVLASIEVFDPGDGTNGGFIPGGSLGQARSDHVASLLPDGDVLIAGGAAAGSSLTSADTWDAGSVGNASWRAQLTSVPASVTAGQSAVIAGSGLTGISQAGDGSTQSSTTDYPVALWMPVQGGWGTVGRLVAWSDTGASWTPPPTALSGPGWLFTATAGIPGTAKPSTVRPAQPSASCTVGSQCQSGFCVDGVCCDSACDQKCEACSAALKGSGADGACGPVAKGTDPKDQCLAAPQETCKTTGECDGAGACELFAKDTVCFPASCSGPVLSPAFLCDGLGTCSPSKAEDCSPNLCKTTGKVSACGSSCVNQSECAPNSFCKQGVCTALQKPGEPCVVNAQCLSNNCVDGVCCNSACDQTCAACTKAKTGVADGLCAPVTSGTDPNNECDKQAATSCGQDGSCSGAFSCELYDKTTECGQPSCFDGEDHSTALKSFCDGRGSCGQQEPSSCGNYKCGPTACLTTCLVDDECAALFRCDAQKHTCVPRGQGICIREDEAENTNGKQNCAPFLCDPSSGTCRTSCGSAADCKTGYECNSDGRCARPFPVSQPNGCGCTVPGRHSPRNSPWQLVAFGLVLVEARRYSRRPA